MRSLCYLEGGCLKKPLNTRKTCSVGLTRNFTLAQGDNSVNQFTWSQISRLLYKYHVQSVLQFCIAFYSSEQNRLESDCEY